MTCDFRRRSCGLRPSLVAVLLGCTVAVLVTAPPAVGDDAVQVVIERAPFSIRPAATYDIPLRLQSIREIQLVALVDGLVLPFRVKPGEKVAKQTELLRLDSRSQQLEVDRAGALLQAAKDEADKGGSKARIDVAQKELELAQLRLEQTLTRMPWDGVVYDVHVAEGQFVRAGDPLVTVADPTKLFVDAPVERSSAKVGDSIDLKVEELTVPGKLIAVMPLSARLDPLRGLFQSVASGRIEVDNAEGRFVPGQTVYSPMIPRQPVGEAPTAAVANADDGGRKVQVIRDGMIRDVPVQLLGQVGEEHVWVSGRFAEADQLILRTSEPLPDGTLVTPKNFSDHGMTPPSANPAAAPGTPARTTNF